MPDSTKPDYRDPNAPWNWRPRSRRVRLWCIAGSTVTMLLSIGEFAGLVHSLPVMIGGLALGVVSCFFAWANYEYTKIMVQIYG